MTLAIMLCLTVLLAIPFVGLADLAEDIAKEDDPTKLWDAGAECYNEVWKKIESCLASFSGGDDVCSVEIIDNVRDAFAFFTAYIALMPGVLNEGSWAEEVRRIYGNCLLFLSQSMLDRPGFQAQLCSEMPSDDDSEGTGRVYVIDPSEDSLEGDPVLAEGALDILDRPQLRTDLFDTVTPIWEIAASLHAIPGDLTIVFPSGVPILMRKAPKAPPAPEMWSGSTAWEATTHYFADFSEWPRGQSGLGSAYPGTDSYVLSAMARGTVGVPAPVPLKLWHTPFELSLVYEVLGWSTGTIEFSFYGAGDASRLSIGLIVTSEMEVRFSIASFDAAGSPVPDVLDAGWPPRTSGLEEAFDRGGSIQIGISRVGTEFRISANGVRLAAVDPGDFSIQGVGVSLSGPALVHVTSLEVTQEN